MDQTLQISISILIIPLLVSLVIFFLRKVLPKPILSGVAITGALTIFALSLILAVKYYNQSSFLTTYKWVVFPGLHYFSTGIFLNNISLIMLLIVTGISLLVQVFSLEYMKHDKSYGRYFSFLAFFTFSMLGIVMSSNLLTVFIFWELVGFSSYLLIGFWYTKTSAVQASKKAFLVNRFGDIGFLLGILIIWSLFKTLDFNELEVVTYLSNGTSSWLIFLAGLGLFAGCIGKSAQFPLQIWLPDAMEGPTPVSALIHAATMVAAGIFLLARVFFILSIDVLTIIAFLGAMTAFMGAVAALRQYDIKKVLAYSTISQLGYMVLGMGVGAYQASFFHLVTHAFFKAGLFLSAGAVIHALHEAVPEDDGHLDLQDMRNMGGLKRYLPITFICFCITSSALMGLPFTSGFLSKDAIITSTLAWANIMKGEIGFVSYLIPALSLITVFLTAFYMGRQIIMVFFGRLRVAENIDTLKEIKVKEPSFPVTIPLIILSLLSLFVLFSLNPFNLENSMIYQSLGRDLRFFPSKLFMERNIILTNLEKTVSNFHLIGLVLSVVLSFTGIIIAIKKYWKTDILQEKKSGVFFNLSFNNWFLDKIYEKTFVYPLNQLSMWTSLIDSKIINPFIHLLAYITVLFAICVKGFDKIIVDGVVNTTVYLTSRMGILARSFQGGKVQYYFIVVLLSLITIIYFIAF